MWVKRKYRDQKNLVFKFSNIVTVSLRAKLKFKIGNYWPALERVKIAEEEISVEVEGNLYYNQGLKGCSLEVEIEMTSDNDI